MPDAAKETVPGKLRAVSVTVIEAVEPRLTVREVALKLVATEPIVVGSVTVWLGSGVGMTLDVPDSTTE